MNDLTRAAVGSLKSADISPAAYGAIGGGLGTAGLLSIPAIYGAMSSPGGHRAEGAYRGVRRFGAGLVGGALGGLAGGGLGGAIGHDVFRTDGGAGVSAGIGGLLGAGLGAYGGDALSRYLMGGKPSYERNQEEVDAANNSPIRGTVSVLAGGMPDILNPETVGMTESRDPEMHSKQVNHGAGRALGTGVGAVAGGVGGQLLAQHIMESNGGKLNAAALAALLGVPLLGGLAGYGVGSAMMGKYPRDKKHQ